MKKRKTVGLALGSGGIRGLAHVGVIKTLLKYDIPIDFLAGCSIGAWVACHYALYEDIDRLEEYTVYRKKEKAKVFLEPAIKGGLVRGTKAKELLDDWFKKAEFKDTKIPVQVVATDLISGQPVIISEGNMAEAVYASMAVPTLFKPLKYEDKILTDGGVSNPVPDDIVRHMGADIVIAVNLDNYHRNKTFTMKDISLKKTANRSFDIMRHYLAEYSIASADIAIEPHVSNMSMLSLGKYFTKDIGQQIVKIGEEETEKMIDHIKKLL
ncbi:MAG: patatin-like phospholipase family protein [Candidatus Komeilibacteria bacterium]